MKVFFRISTRIFHILDQSPLLFCQENMRSINSCVTAKNLAKFLWKIFFPVTISLDTEQTKKFHQRFLELKASALRTSDEISSFSKLQEISPLKLSCHDFFLQKCYGDDFSWYWANEEILSEVLRVEGFNSMNLWWNFFVLLVARDIALETFLSWFFFAKM